MSDDKQKLILFLMDIPDTQIKKGDIRSASFRTAEQAIAKGRARDLTPEEREAYLYRNSQSSENLNEWKAKQQTAREMFLHDKAKLCEDEEELRDNVLGALARRSKEGDEEARDLIVQYVANKERILARRSDNPELFIYDKSKGIYVPEGRAYLRELIERITGRAFKRHFASEVIERITIRSYVEDEDIFQVREPYKVVVANGVLNLLTGELTPFSPELQAFTRIPAEYNPEISPEPIKDFLESCGHDEKTVRQLIEFAAFTLVRNYRIPRGLIMTGTGRNGKDVWAWVLTNLVGQENVSQITLHDLIENRFAKAYLLNKHINISTETAERKLLETDVYKAATGESKLQADVKHERAVQFINFAKMCFSCNQLPETEQQSPAFWYRILLTSWNKRFVTADEYEAVPDEEKAHFGIKNPNLREELTKPRVLSGLLNWCVEVLPGLIQRGDYYGIQTPEEIERDYTRKSNDVAAFWEECAELETGAKGDTKELIYSSYAHFCSNELKVQAKKDNVFWRKSREFVELNIIHTTNEDGRRERIVSKCVIKPKWRNEWRGLL